MDCGLHVAQFAIHALVCFFRVGKEGSLSILYFKFLSQLVARLNWKSCLVSFSKHRRSTLKFLLNWVHLRLVWFFSRLLFRSFDFMLHVDLFRSWILKYCFSIRFERHVDVLLDFFDFLVLLKECAILFLNFVLILMNIDKIFFLRCVVVELQCITFHNNLIVLLHTCHV